MPILTSAFLVALLAMVAIRWWLATRQLRAVAGHRDSVPAPFAATISAEEHARAADYTQARIRLARIELLWEAVLLLAVTLGGGLAALDAAVARLGAGPLAHGVAVLALLALALGALGLPFDLYRSF
ncbi:MAG: M48 family peptidase, partial [Proteobacteria bacterium]|nr:M48 family peptidase [Pseudomonadota bacterium]